MALYWTGSLLSVLIRRHGMWFFARSSKKFYNLPVRPFRGFRRCLLPCEFYFNEPVSFIRLSFFSFPEQNLSTCPLYSYLFKNYLICLLYICFLVCLIKSSHFPFCSGNYNEFCVQIYIYIYISWWRLHFTLYASIIFHHWKTLMNTIMDFQVP
jgi:hypothetical protein